MTKLTDLAALQDAEGFQTAFEDRLANKVADALEMRKIEVAQNFFAPVVQNEEVEEKDPHDRMMDTAYNAALKAGHTPHSMGFTKDRKKIKMISDTGHGHYDIASKKYVHSKVNEEVEQIDELSKGTLGKYIGKAVVDVHNDAKWAGESGSKDASNKAFKRLLGVKSAAARLSKQNVSGGRISNYRAEEVEGLDEREMTAAEMDKREKIVKGMKKSVEGFRKRYGSRAKDVMYATATKKAME